MATALEELVTVLPAQGSASSASLVSGIIGDVQSLVRQEIALVRQETLEDLGRLKSTGSALVPAAALLAFGGLLLVLALAQGMAALLHWPNWAGYASIGAILGITGSVLISIHRTAAPTVKESPHD